MSIWMFTLSNVCVLQFWLSQTLTPRSLAAQCDEDLDASKAGRISISKRRRVTQEFLLEARLAVTRVNELDFAEFLLLL